MKKAGIKGGAQIILAGFLFLSMFALIGGLAEIESTDWVVLNNTFVKRAGDNMTGNLNNTENITARYFKGDGTYLTNLPLGSTYNATYHATTGTVNDYLNQNVSNGASPTFGNIITSTINSTANITLSPTSLGVNLGIPGVRTSLTWYDSASVNYAIRTYSDSNTLYFYSRSTGAVLYLTRFNDLRGVGVNIGTETNPWGTARFNSIIMTGNIIPKTNITYDLGSSIVSWNNTYTKTLWQGSAGAAKGGLNELININLSSNDTNKIKQGFPTGIYKNVTLKITQYKVKLWNDTEGNTQEETVNWNYQPVINATVREAIQVRESREEVPKGYVPNVANHELVITESFLSVFDELRMSEKAIQDLYLIVQEQNKTLQRICASNPTICK